MNGAGLKDAETGKTETQKKIRDKYAKRDEPILFKDIRNTAESSQQMHPMGRLDDDVALIFDRSSVSLCTGVFLEIDERTVKNVAKMFAFKMQDANTIRSYTRRGVLTRKPSFTTLTMLRGMDSQKWVCRGYQHDPSKATPAEKLMDILRAPEWERVNIEEVGP